jgi:hypothetical protein
VRRLGSYAWFAHSCREIDRGGHVIHSRSGKMLAYFSFGLQYHGCTHGFWSAGIMSCDDVAIEHFPKRAGIWSATSNLGKRRHHRYCFGELAHKRYIPRSSNT